jgi:hypothetical protein
MAVAITLAITLAGAAWRRAKATPRRNRLMITVC